MNGEETLRDIQLRLSKASAARARAEVELETAQTRRTEAVAALKTEFGIESSDQIAKLTVQLDQEYADAHAAALAALDAAEAH